MTTDDQIKEAIQAGTPMKQIKRELGIGTHRLYRVKRELLGEPLTRHTSINGRTMGHARFIKTTVQLGPDGEVEREWPRFAEDISEAALLESFAKGLTESMDPKEPRKTPAIKNHTDKLMTGVFLGDAHIGMYAYGPETTHSDFDTNIATRQIREAIDYLVEKAEPTHTGMLIDVGDLMHANTQHNQTYSGTPLDVDTRHHRVMEKAAEVMVYAIERMKEKHKKVVVCIARGNHNTDAAPAVQLILSFFYSKDDRVQVLRTEGFYHYIEYGRWLLGVHHGDKQKPESLAGTMARDMPGAWGRTTHRLWCTGHFHKEAVKTLPGCKHKVFGALPPPDSWHASHGFMGDGEMEMLTFRRDGGLYSSHVYNIPRPIIEPDVKL